MIKGLNDSLVQAYHSLQIDMAVLFGANKSEAESDMKKALDFEYALAKVKMVCSKFCLLILNFSF
jgi:hypothetical protein